MPPTPRRSRAPALTKRGACRTSDLVRHPFSLPEAWGRGYAAEACTAALDWFAAPPDEPVVLCT